MCWCAVKKLLTHSLRAKFHIDPSNRLATIHNVIERHGQIDRQRSDSIARTVLQTVAQKLAEWSTVRVQDVATKRCAHN